MEFTDEGIRPLDSLRAKTSAARFLRLSVCFVMKDRKSYNNRFTYAESQKSRSIQRSSLALACFPPSRSATSDKTDNYDKDDYNAYIVTS
uniref:Uncharacterized protein n=1 Tax=Panagrellus redivivus TaxID=6233 RepID=A0A7E4UTC2_PANRE